jgi:hypothetical protein
VRTYVAMLARAMVARRRKERMVIGGYELGGGRRYLWVTEGRMCDVSLKE